MRSKSQEAQNHDNKTMNYSKSIPCLSEENQLLNFYLPKQEQLYLQFGDSRSTGVIDSSNPRNIDYDQSYDQSYTSTNRKNIKKKRLSGSDTIDKNSMIAYEPKKETNERGLVENKFNQNRTNEEVYNRIDSFLDKERITNLHSPNNGQVNLSSLDPTKPKNYLSSASKIKQSVIPKLRTSGAGGFTESSKDNCGSCIDKHPTDIKTHKFNASVYMALRSSGNNRTKRQENLEADSGKLKRFNLYNKPKLLKTDPERVKTKPLLTTNQATSKNKKRLHLKGSSIVSSSVLFLQQVRSGHDSSCVDTYVPTPPTRKRSLISEIRCGSIKQPSTQKVHQNTIENEDAVLLLDFVDSVTSSVSQYSDFDSNSELLADLSSTETKYMQQKNDAKIELKDETVTTGTSLNCSDQPQSSDEEARNFDPYISSTTLVKSNILENHSSQLDTSTIFDSNAFSPASQLALSISSENSRRNYYKRCANHIKIAYAICYHRDQELFRNLSSDSNSNYKADHNAISTQSRNNILHLEDSNIGHANDGSNRSSDNFRLNETIFFEPKRISVVNNDEAFLPDTPNYDKPNPKVLNLLQIKGMSHFQDIVLPKVKYFDSYPNSSACIDNLRPQNCIEQQQNDPFLIPNMQAYQQQLLIPHNSVAPSVTLTTSNSISSLNLMNRGQPTVSLQQTSLKVQPLFNYSFIMNASNNVVANCGSDQVGAIDPVTFRFPRSSMNLQNPIQFQLHQTQLQRHMNLATNIVPVPPSFLQ